MIKATTRSSESRQFSILTVPTSIQRIHNISWCHDGKLEKSHCNRNNYGIYHTCYQVSTPLNMSKHCSTAFCNSNTIKPVMSVVVWQSLVEIYIKVCKKYQVSTLKVGKKCQVSTPRVQ